MWYTKMIYPLILGYDATEEVYVTYCVYPQV